MGQPFRRLKGRLKACTTVLLCYCATVLLCYCATVLQNLRFFAPRDDFSSGFAVKLIQLIDAGPGSSDYGNDDGPPRRADVITVTARDLLDDSVGS
jgi:hypothetical protein